MRQLLLEWGAAKPQTLDSFVVGRNQELAALLTLIANQAANALDQRFVTIWGEAGAGKTHLLRALETTGAARYLPADAALPAFEWSPLVRLYLLDDCEALPTSFLHCSISFLLFSIKPSNPLFKLCLSVVSSSIAVLFPIKAK